jgi:hypothetical protein
MIGLLLVAFAVPALAQETTRAEFQEYCDLQVGRWIGDVTWVTDWPGFGKKGDKVTCYFEAKMVEDGNVMTTRFFGGAGSGTGLVFYDAAAKKIRLTWANSNGAMSLAVAFKKNGKWVEKGSGSLADGRKTEFTSTMNIEADGKTHTWTGSGTVGGEKTDDQCDIWRRVDE